MVTKGLELKKRSNLSWFVAGCVASVLMAAAANAISFFIRAKGWRPLIEPDTYPQAIGFPYEIWRLGGSYTDGAIIDNAAMNTNVVMALGAGVIVGVFFVGFSGWLERFAEFMAELESRNVQPISLQFSTGGLLLFTTIVAALFALLRSALGATPELLMGIYMLGPASLILLAMIPRGLNWQQRVILLAPSTLLLIGFAMFVGIRMTLPFEHVMLGIFVCWVPQSVIAAVCLVIWTGIKFAIQSKSGVNQE